MSESKNGYVQVKGVLKYNNETREQMLRRIYWKDEEYVKYATGVGEYRNIDTKEISPVTEGKGLYAYTQEETGKFGHEINRKYIPKVEKENYESRPYENDLHKWDGNYVEIFTDNNKLGEIGDSRYLQLMTWGNYANADRFLEDKYLTPNLINLYGSNPQIEGENGYFNVFNRVGGVYKHESGRIADIPEAEAVKIIEYSENIENNGGVYYMKQVFSNAQKNDEKPKYDITQNEKYVEYSRIKEEPRGVFDTKTFNQELNSAVLNGNNLKNSGNGNRLKNLDLDSAQITDDNFIWSEKDNVPNNYTIYKRKDLLGKTSEMFKLHKINTMVSRFYDKDYQKEGYNQYDTAISKTYGHSHGRNLMKLDAAISDNKEKSGYDNPYCRTWTNNHQYSKLSDLIRPFNGGDISIEEVQYVNKKFRATNGTKIENGGKYLANNTVLNNNGFVNITPVSKEHGTEIEIKKCMFSIENLAWKDVVKKEEYISKEQQGPNGGRIMWFPPYDLDFQENVNVEWDQNSFLGRGEKVYTYKNTDRTGTLSFSLLIDHPNIVNYLQGKKGMGEENDLEADVLRYFAGCGILDIGDDELSPQNTADEEVLSSEPVVVPSPENSKHIKVYVYYPNNYSGNFTPETKESWNIKGYSDEDWFYYLLLGNGTNVNLINQTTWNGYEMSENSLGEDLNPLPTMLTVSGCTQWKVDEYKGKPKYHYRPDFDLRQILYGEANYKDNASFGLNSKINNDVNDGNYSFAEFWVAIMAANKEKFSVDNEFIDDLKAQVIKCGADKKRIEELIKDFSSEQFKPTEATVCGAATLQDSAARGGCEKTNSEMLADRRCKSLAFAVDEYLLKNTDITCERLPNEIQDKLKDNTTVNTKEAKAQRYAVIEITYNAPEIIKKSEDNSQEYGSINGTVIGVDEEENISFSDNFIDESLLETEDMDVSKELNRIIYNGSYDKNAFSRYETESEYFYNLSKNSPVAFNSLVEKFKYFSPAFHSISPEGFNARLNFLHQCTRQGYTIETSDLNGYAKTAGNLSFGRMPICVLRIGDFINTRILINNLTINYGEGGGMQWDLNPEGAGVQPMYAKISLGIVILGGQSLEGPINRLQNAVSFDYYANTGVYDNRADRVTIKDGKTIYKHIWTPLPEKVDNN